MELLDIEQGGGAGAPKSIEEAQRKIYQFWDTQPVPKLSKCLLTTILCLYSTHAWRRGVSVLGVCRAEGGIEIILIVKGGPGEININFCCRGSVLENFNYRGSNDD